MRRWQLVPIGALVAFLVACSDSTAPADSYESIAGSYDGALAGVSQGVALDATFSLTINQTGGTATGSWALQGLLDDGFDLYDVQARETSVARWVPETIHR
jgi:hypothetical protein